MENNLKNRYIYAVTRHLPKKIASDVEQELDSLITEMADERGGIATAPLNGPARAESRERFNEFSAADGTDLKYDCYSTQRPIGQQCPTGQPCEEDIKSVLTELGSPEEMALKYYGSDRKSLISGVYYLMYKRVLHIALPALAAVIAVITTLGLLIGDEPALNIVIGVTNVTFAAHVMQILAVTIGGVLQAFAVITVLFAVLDYMKVDIKAGDFNSLPEIPEGKMKISPDWPISGIILSVSLTALLLGFPQVMRLRLNYTWVPVFDTAVIRGLWLPILLWSVLEISIEILKLVEGRYTKRLGMAVVVTNIAQAIFAIAIFGGSGILNPEFMSYIENLNIEAFYWIRNLGSVFTLLDRPNIILLIIILFSLLIETADAAFKSFRH